MTLRSNQAEHDVLKEMRQKQKTQQWKERYAKRAGIEGTVSQGVRAFGLRQERNMTLDLKTKASTSKANCRQCGVKCELQ
jgi:transposase